MYGSFDRIDTSAIDEPPSYRGRLIPSQPGHAGLWSTTSQVDVSLRRSARDIRNSENLSLRSFTKHLRA